MTPKEKALVRRSLVKLREQPEAITSLFYDRLFAINPGSRRLFARKDMNLQGMAFLQMLSMFVRSLEEEDPVVAEAIKASGRRHVGYGVVYSDYEAVGEALLWAVDELLGPRATPEMHSAWSEAYRVLTTTMRQASSSVL